jgi:hypothetical protein
MLPARRTARRSGVLALFAVAMLIVLNVASGCSHDKPAAAYVPPQPATPNDALEAHATKLALDAYNGYMSAYVAAATTADWRDTAVDQFTADPFRAQLHTALHGFANAGVVFTGKPTYHPQVHSVSMDTDPEWILLVDCLDISGWKAVFRSGGKTANAPNQLTRYRVTAKVVLYPDGTWYLQQVDTQRTTPC